MRRYPKARVLDANGTLTIQQLVDQYLSWKRHALDNRDITVRSFAEIYASCQQVGDTFGWDRPIDSLIWKDFDRLRRAISATQGPASLSVNISRVRTLFKFGYDAELIDRPPRFGPAFKPPSAKVMRMNRAAKGLRMLEAAQAVRVIDAAGTPMKAMILLGLNCGFGNADVATLPMKALDLDAGWVNYPRPKTGVPRRCPLWPETVAAIREALRKRMQPREGKHKNLVFITHHQQPWQQCELRVDPADLEPVTGIVTKGTTNLKLKCTDAVAQQFIRLLRSLGLHREGLGFYCLRHTFETIGGDTGDQIAVDALMGHSRNDMASVYRERINDDRLRRVTDYIRTWLALGVQA